ncbi:MAG: DUF4403 family protein [Saprospiraceae bacterium]|nr:DUF4403 family protein [Saprospiraceae bacterium]
MSACGTKKEIVYVPVKQSETQKDFYTDLIINYRLDKSGIKDTFNRSIEETFKTSFNLPDFDIKMTLSKPKEATVEIEGKNILVVIPVGILVEKQTLLANLKAKGVLEMSFITDVDLDSTWNLKTKTNLSVHRWIEKPKLNIAGLNLPIEMISNVIIKKTKSQIEQSIDDGVKESFTIKQKMKETMRMFDQPIQMDPNVSAWLNIKPEKIQLNRIINSRFSAQGKISIKALSTFTTYKPVPVPASLNLPKVYWNETIPDSSLFRLVADIQMYDVNTLIKANLDGQTFTAGDKTITLSNIVTNCDYEFLRVVTDVAGSVNGTLIIKGRPKYDAAANNFYLEHIDIQLKTKNVIHKAAAWIAEGKIRNEMEKMLKFSIKDNVAKVQENINAQIAAINSKYNMEMKVNIGSVDVESFELKPGQIQALMRSKFYLEIRLKDFRTFNKF